MHKVELRQVIGKFKDRRGNIRRVGWDMDILLLNGLHIATINRVPGAAIQLMPHAQLTPTEELAVMEAIKASPRGAYPAGIGKTVTPYELLDDEELESEETEVDGE